MQTDIYDAAIRLGFTDARPVTGHPFNVWRDRLASIPLGKYFSFEHDPAAATGWLVGEITLWAAVAPTPPTAEWPEGCGEVGGFYMCSDMLEKRRIAWEDAAAEMGYEVARGVMLPERAAAIRAGLGVHGLNGLLISPDHGSFVNIALLLIREAPPPEARGPEHDLSPGCGNCGDCARACPTGAISDDGVDVLICLRNYMNRPERMTEEDYPRMGRMILGCDICQLACPKNASIVREAPPEDMARRVRLEDLLSGPDIGGMSKYIFHTYLNEKMIRRQAVLAAANTGRTDLLPSITELAETCGEDDTTKKIALWAVKKLSE